MLGFHGLDIRFFDARQFAAVREIDLDIIQLYGLLEGSVQRAVRVPDGFGGELPEAVISAQEAIIDVLDVVRAQFGEFDLAQMRHKANLDRRAVFVQRARLDVHTEIIEPCIEPLLHRQLRRRDINAVVDGRCDLLEALPDFLLRLAVDGFLNLLACTRIAAHGITSFPCAIFALADRAAALSVTGCLFSGHAFQPLP